MQINSQILLLISPYVSIISHTPGRIRVRVSSQIKKLNLKLEGLDKEVSSINGIKNVKFNPIIGSITIEYDKNVIEPSFWNDLISGENTENILAKINGAMR